MHSKIKYFLGWFLKARADFGQWSPGGAGFTRHVRMGLLRISPFRSLLSVFLLGGIVATLFVDAVATFCCLLSGSMPRCPYAVCPHLADALPMLYRCFADVLLTLCQYCADALQTLCRCFADALPATCLRFAHAWQ